MAAQTSSKLPDYDQVIVDITDYVFDYEIQGEKAWKSARIAIRDALGCAIETAAKNSELKRFTGPVVPGTTVPDGFRLPGTSHRLDPVKGAFDLGSMIRYMDHNDALAGADWGHPSDNLGAILAVMDWLCRSSASGRLVHVGPPLTMHTLLVATIKAYEVQGCFLLRNAFNAFGLDHTILVKLASTAVVSWLLGLTKPQTMAAISHVWMDVAPLRVYRAGSNTIPRKGWAAGDACMRAVQFALITQKGQPGSPTVLTMPRWGFYATTWRGGPPFQFPKPYATWVIENIFYKVMPVEGHGIAAVEAAVIQGKKLRARGLDPRTDISRIEIRTCAAANMIINKTGPLYNAADRDHCMQYVVSVALLKGVAPEAVDFQDSSKYVSSPDVNALRDKINIRPDEDLTKDYMNLEKKSIPSAVTIYLTNGDVLDEVLVEFPLGHMENPGTPLLVHQKFNRNMTLMFSEEEVKGIVEAIEQAGDMSISKFVDQLARVGEPKL